MCKLDTWLRLSGAVCLVFCLSCIEELNTPDVSGPSALSISMEMTAVPDRLVADGWSSSVIEVVYRDENGQRRSGMTVKFDLGARTEIVTGGAFSDIGNLAPLDGPRPVAGGTESHAVSDVTDSDGVARARYWSPFRTDQANDIAVTITARPAGDDFRGETFRQVDIQLVAADRPLFPGTDACGFSVEPMKQEYEVDEPVFFTATQATGSGSGGGSCGGQPIARYEWDFGDGHTDVGRSVSHVFSGGCEAGCTVTLITTESQTGCVDSCSTTIRTPAGTGGGGTPGGGGPPGGGNCGTITINSADIDFSIPQPGATELGPKITVTAYNDCVIRDVIVETSISGGVDLATAFPGTGFIRLEKVGVFTDFYLISVPDQFGGPPSGTDFGDDCGDIIFQDGGASLPSGAPSYNGTFAPYGRPGSLGSFGAWNGLDANGEYYISAGDLGGFGISVRCFTLTLVLQDK